MNIVPTTELDKTKFFLQIAVIILSTAIIFIWNIFAIATFAEFFVALKHADFLRLYFHPHCHCFLISFLLTMSRYYPSPFAWFSSFSLQFCLQQLPLFSVDLNPFWWRWNPPPRNSTDFLLRLNQHFTTPIDRSVCVFTDWNSWGSILRYIQQNVSIEYDEVWNIKSIITRNSFLSVKTKEFISTRHLDLLRYPYVTTCLTKGLFSLSADLIVSKLIRVIK